MYHIKLCAKQWCAGKWTLEGWRWGGRRAFRWQFPWCKYSHHSWFQAPSSLKNKLKVSEHLIISSHKWVSDGSVQPWKCGGSIREEQWTLPGMEVGEDSEPGEFELMLEDEQDWRAESRKKNGPRGGNIICTLRVLIHGVLGLRKLSVTLEPDCWKPRILQKEFWFLSKWDSAGAHENYLRNN